MKATFIDFDDSFSYNVVQALSELGFEIKVIHWKDYETNPTEGLLVLGPGPGHPSDYERIFSLVSDWLKEKKPFFGVCLGHQIFWYLQGEEVVRSKEPLHGQRIKLDLTLEWKEWFGLKQDVFVQRYNSLMVPSQAAIRNPFFENFIQNDEILITRSLNVITYQFHPESVGTTFRKELMRPVCSII